MENKTLASVVKSAREKLGISQRELSRRTGIDNNTVAKIEKGERKKPNVLSLRKIALVLELDSKELIKLAGYSEEEYAMVSSKAIDSIDYDAPMELINKIGKIDCWSEKNYLLTENYVIIVSDNMVNCFKYDRIKKIRKQVEYNFKTRYSNFPDYLYLILNDDTEYKIEITEISIMSKKYCDISSYILEKNKAIIIEETIVKINNHKL